jgi:peroxidase
MEQSFIQKGLCLLSLFVLLGLKGEAQTHAKYRTYDGTKNNLTNTSFGKASIPLYRELPAEYSSSDTKNALGGSSRPSPRVISNKLSHEPEDRHNARKMAGLFYSWGQFIDHDITLTPGNPDESNPIPVPSNDRYFSKPIPFHRSATHPGTGKTNARDQTNLQTSWIDGSHVYGYNSTIANWLRTFSNGKLKTSSGNMLPFNTLSGEYNSSLDPKAPKMDDDNGRTKKTFAAGDPRAAEHPGLTSLHTLFVREHNKICDKLKSQGMSNDEEIYQKARKEVGALIQAITYGQWISSLGVQLSSYPGYKASVRPDVRNTFSTAAYRWHTMVENDIIFRDNECHGVGPSELPLKEVFFNISIVRKYDIGVLLKGLSVHRSYETDLKVNHGLRNFLFGPGSGLDLVSLNLQRGRDHGLPNYNKVRQFYTGAAARSFSEITSSSSMASDMQSLYKDLSTIDLWAGLYAEPLLSGKSVGKTVDAILRMQLEALRDGDYYYFMNDPDLSADRSRLLGTKLGDVISRNSSAGNFQDNVFFVKNCSSSSEFDDIAHYPCSATPQFDGWTFIGKQSSKTYYKWNGGNANFEEAKHLVKRLGGHLPQIGNATENNALKTYLSGGSAWLDLNRTSSSLFWKYSNTFNMNDAVIIGAYSLFYNWNVGRPIYTSTTENRVEMTSSGKWSDISESSLRPVIAEVPCHDECANDRTPPVFTYCPSNITPGTVYDAPWCKIVRWNEPSAVDNCGGNVLVRQDFGYWNGYCSNTVMSQANTVIYSATDARGNKSICSFIIFPVVKSYTYFSKDQEVLSLEAKGEPNRTLLTWVSNLAKEKATDFIVQKQNVDSQQFEDLTTIANTNKVNEFMQFAHYDTEPKEGDNFYRIVAVMSDGTTKESEIKKVSFAQSSFVNVYPNPVESELMIDLKNYKNETVSLYLYNTLGQPIIIKHIDAAASTLVTMDVSDVVVGQYILRVAAKGKKDVTKQVSVSH